MGDPDLPPALGAPPRCDSGDAPARDPLGEAAPMRALAARPLPLALDCALETGVLSWVRWYFAQSMPRAVLNDSVCNRTGSSHASTAMLRSRSRKVGTSTARPSVSSLGTALTARAPVAAARANVDESSATREESGGLTRGVDARDPDAVATFATFGGDGEGEVASSLVELRTLRGVRVPNGAFKCVPSARGVARTRRTRCLVSIKCSSSAGGRTGAVAGAAAAAAKLARERQRSSGEGEADPSAAAVSLDDPPSRRNGDASVPVGQKRSKSCMCLARPRFPRSSQHVPLFALVPTYTTSRRQRERGAA